MNEPMIVIPLAIALAGIFLWLLVTGRKSSKGAVPSFSSLDLLPTARNYGYFPQIRQALSIADSNYLRENAPRHVAKSALRERRAVARGFLRGLHEDFSNLAKLGRVIATLSPEISHKQETERFFLSMKFQILYYLVSLRLAAGYLPLEQLENLTGLIGRLATRMDAAMAEISALSAGPVQGGIGV